MIEDAMLGDGAGLRLAFVLCLAGLTMGLCVAASRSGLLSDAVSARSNHKRPTSRAGGAIIVVVSVLAFGGVHALGADLPQPPLALSGAVTAAGLLGLADDAFGLGPFMKLAALTVIAAVIAGAAGPVAAMPLPVIGWIALPTGLGYALAAAWVLGFVNVFNFLDGLNGMAAATGLVLLCGIGALGGGSVLTLCLVGALLGFAVPNILHGRPFLGDAGSLAVGTAIAGSALAADGGSVWLVAGGAMAFLADAALTLWRRARSGEPLTQAHSDHAYQRLHRAGWSHQGVSSLYALIALAAMGAGIALGSEAAWVPLVIAGGALALWLVGVRTMARAKSAVV